MTLYEKITVLRERLGISQSELERNAGLSKGTITNWKTKSPNVASLEKVAEALGCDVRNLLSNDDAMPYYINDEAREMAQFMFENPEYKVLFDASRRIGKSDIETVKAIMDKFRSDN